MTQSEFEKLILDLKENLFRLAFSILKDEDEAKDAVQEVVFRLWKQRRKLDTQKNIDAFCLRSIKNYCLDVVRKQKHQNRYLEQKRETESNTFSYEKTDLIQKIKEELANLPLQYRMAIELKDFRGFEYAEISEILNMPINTVRVNVSRGRKQLYEIFKEELSYD